VGRLTNGVLLYNSTSFNQGGPVASSFFGSGNFTTVILNDDYVTVNFAAEPDSAHFAHLVLRNQWGTTFTGGLGRARIAGDLILEGTSPLAADSLRVDRNVVAPAGTSITAGLLQLYGGTSIQGAYSVAQTQYWGTGQSIQALPYQSLGSFGTDASFSDNVIARSFEIQTDTFNVNGHTLRVDSLFVFGSGALLMDGAADSVVADTLANFFGSNGVGTLTAGVLQLNGHFRGSGFMASAGHRTRFSGPAAQTAQISFLCEFGCNTPINFGDLVVDGSGGLTILDPNSLGVPIQGDLIVNAGTLIDPSVSSSVNVFGNVSVDATGTLTLGRLGLNGGITFLASPANYQVTNTVYFGTGQSIAVLPYQRLQVAGTAALTAPTTAAFVDLVQRGVLTLGGQRFNIGSNLTVTDSAHLVMQNALDSLFVGGTALFQSDSTEGDFTAGGIHARVFRQTIGPSGSPLGFVQTGTNRLVPQAGDSIIMVPTGPAGSRLQSIDFATASGTVVLNGLWVSGSMSLSNPATIVDATLGGLFVVQGAVVQTDGQIVGPRLAVGSTMAYTAGAYSVDLTVFSGSGQIIDPSVPYRNIEVQYDASLGGSLDLFTGGYSAVVDNSGVLDLAGHSLLAGLFHTEGGGRLKMASSGDTLRVTSIQFNGGSTAGLLTAGLIQTGNFSQTDGNSLLSFGPSGSQKVEIVNIGFVPEGGYSLSMAASAGDTASHFNRLSFLSTAGSRMFSNFYAADSLYINSTLNGATHTVVGGGPIVIGTAAAVTLDTLRVLGTLFVDPSATYTVPNTVFGPAAAPMPALASYANVYLEGAQTLTTPISVGGALYVRGNGVLTPNTKKVSGVNGLWIQDNAHLVMANAADTVDMGNAHFDGPPTGTDLSAGILRLRNGLFESNVVSSQSFA
ncbi:MAG: hypothetical protein ABIQ41_11225, partial [Gemmatimonadales bacterium]